MTVRYVILSGLLCATACSKDGSLDAAIDGNIIDAPSASELPDLVDWNRPPDEPGPQEEKVVEEDLRSTAPVVTPDASIVGNDRGDIIALVAAAREVLASARFRANMELLEATHPSLWLSRAVSPQTPTKFAELLRAPAGANGYLPTRLIWAPAGKNSNWISVGSDPQTGHWTPLMYLGPDHLTRFRSTDVVERSCAINSVAHEMTHMLTYSAPRYRQSVTDADRRQTGGRPNASYFAGTVAQCTYLQDQARVPANGFAQCAATFGLKYFLGGRCDDFKDGREVRPRR